jgi:hypothetical protein
MDLFDTHTWAEILVKTTFLGTPTLTVPKKKKFRVLPKFRLCKILQCLNFDFVKIIVVWDYMFGCNLGDAYCRSHGLKWDFMKKEIFLCEKPIKNL